MMVRFGQCANSALITIGLGETEVLVFFNSASVLDLMISAIVDAETTGLPYSSESSSCFQLSTSSINEKEKEKEKTRQKYQTAEMEHLFNEKHPDAKEKNFLLAK